MTDKPATVQVEIFGQTYKVRAGTDPGYVEQLAKHVDAEMREISKSAGAVDSVRVAVLAALNIADECFRLRGAAGDKTDKLQKRAARLAEELGGVLGE
jgi:cell division protein ZapA